MYLFEHNHLQRELSCTDYRDEVTGLYDIETRHDLFISSVTHLNA